LFKENILHTILAQCYSSGFIDSKSALSDKEEQEEQRRVDSHL
jgi:hypothetical protein